MSKENVTKLMTILARNLNQQVSSIDLSKSFDENGGDSIILMSTITDLKKMGWIVPLNLFEPPRTLQDVVQYINDSFNKQTTANFKVEYFADVQDKDALIDMCSRCFAERSTLELIVNAKAHDLLLLSKSAADIDQKKSLSLVVFDTTSKRYVGGAFVHDFIENDYRFSETINPILALITDLKHPFQLESDTSNLLYISFRYAEPKLPAATHVKIFQQLMTAVIEIAKKNNFRGIVSISTSPVTATINQEAGFQTIKQIRARDYVYNDEHVFKDAPEDFYCRLMVKYF